MKLSSVIRWIALLLALVPALVGSGAAEPPRTPRVATLTSVGISSAATTNDASTLASYDPIAKIVTRQQTGPPPPWRRVSATPIYEPFRQEPTDSAGAIAAEGEGLLNLSAEDSWGNPSSLEDHFLRHGADFGATSADQYANDASQFLQQALKDGYPVKVDADGVIRVYDPETNTFGAYNANGTTRTFFKPTNGAAYWASQPGSTP